MIIEGNVFRPPSLPLCFPLSRRVAVEPIRKDVLFVNSDFINAAYFGRIGTVARFHHGQVHGNALETQISISESPNGAAKLYRQGKKVIARNIHVHEHDAVRL